MKFCRPLSFVTDEKADNDADIAHYEAVPLGSAIARITEYSNPLRHLTVPEAVRFIAAWRRAAEL